MKRKRETINELDLINHANNFSILQDFREKYEKVDADVVEEAWKIAHLHRDKKMKLSDISSVEMTAKISSYVYLSSQARSQVARDRA